MKASLKIALIGYGKMGKEIEKICLDRGHIIHLIADHDKPLSSQIDLLKNADVAIEFSEPNSAYDNLVICSDAGLPVVCGTTGWNEKIPEAHQKVNVNQTAFFWSSNFSIGVNLFFEINKQLAKLMNSYPGYDVEISETHHIHKKDAPSGTAITIAEGVLKHSSHKLNWKGRLNTDDISADENSVLEITSFRKDEVPGTHEVTYKSKEDEIILTHRAFNRRGFALGAVLAAEWIMGKKGIFGMQDMLQNK